MFFEKYSCQTCNTLCSGGEDRQELFVPVEVNSPDGNFDTFANLSLHLYESQNKNFNFDTLKTLILHAQSIFFKGGHPTKILRKKIFFMKTLSKLGALTVQYNNSKKQNCRSQIRLLFLRRIRIRPAVL
jgi:hypothetical protein